MFDDPKTYQLLRDAKTTGCFQVESQLCKKFCKLLKPDIFDHISALIAVVRPGVLEAEDEKGQSLAITFCKRKNGEEQTEYLHPALEPILKDTFGIIVFQEQAMLVATELAGFTLQEADDLRKAAGKKLPEEMAKIKIKFLYGAAKLGILNVQQAEQIFEWIEKSQRYSFNKCISGNEKLKRASIAKDAFHPTVAEMYEIKNDIEYAKTTGHNDLRKKYRLSGGYGYGMSMFPDGRIRKNKIIDIQPAGTRKVYKLTLKNGASIVITDNHKFPTDKGELTLKEIQENNPNLYFYGGQKGFPSHLIEIDNIEYLREEETYDITMEGPNHNFVNSEGIVTCNSHSVSYAVISYAHAYIKAHLTKKFICSWLTYTKDEAHRYEKVEKLVLDSKLYINQNGRPIDILLPDLRVLNSDFQIEDDNVRFGITDIKGVGQNTFEALKVSLEKFEKNPKDWTWHNFLIWSLTSNKTVVEALIASGSVNYLNISKKRMYFEYDKISELSKGEVCWLIENGKDFSSITESLTELMKPRTDGSRGPNKNRVQTILGIIASIKNPSYSLKDSHSFIAHEEKKVLGVSITCTTVDDYSDESANCDCSEINRGKTGYIALNAEISSVKETAVKKEGKNKGKKMAFLSVRDLSGGLDNIVCFSDAWEKFSTLFTVGNAVLLIGERNDQKSGLIIKGAHQL